LSNDIRITLIRSLSGRPESIRRVVKGLGLTRNTPEIRGMVEKVKFLLHVEEAGESS
jgi:large subunit ribosomal protein L30